MGNEKSVKEILQIIHARQSASAKPMISAMLEKDKKDKDLKEKDKLENK